MAPHRTLLASALLAVFFVSSALIGSDTQFAEVLPANDHLLPVKVNGLWGYCDASGRVVIKPKFGWAQDFSDGFALVALDKKIAYIDGSGSVVFESPFTHDHSPFVEKFARGSVGLEFHFLRADGKLLGPAFAATQNFCEGLAAVCIDPTRFARQPQAGRDDDWEIHGKWGFIDASGRLVVKADYIAVGHFSEGLAPVYVGGRNIMCTGLCEGKWGFVNRQGELVIGPQFVSAQSFSGGLAAVSRDGQSTGYINTAGEFVIAPRPFSIATSFHDGVARIRGSEKLRSAGWKDFGYIDRSGTVFVHPNFSSTDPFSEGLSIARQKPVWNKDKREWIQGPYGYVNKQGEWEIPPQFTHAQAFSGGVARVQNESGLGYINRTGRFIWPPSK